MLHSIKMFQLNHKKTSKEFFLHTFIGTSTKIVIGVSTMDHSIDKIVVEQNLSKATLNGDKVDFPTFN